MPELKDDHKRLIDSLDLAEKAEALNPGVALDAAVALRRCKRDDEALSLIEQVLEHRPRHPRGLAEFGTTCRRLGLYDRALRHLEGIASRAPTCVEAHLQLAITLRELNCLGMARSRLRAIARCETHQARVLMELGFLHRFQGDHRRALRCFATVIRRHPAHLPGYMAAGMECMRMGRAADAAAYFDALLRRNQSAGEARFQSALAKMVQGHRADALDRFLRLIERDPGRLPAYLGASIQFHLLGDVHKSRIYRERWWGGPLSKTASLTERLHGSLRVAVATECTITPLSGASWEQRVQGGVLCCGHTPPYFHVVRNIANQEHVTDLEFLKRTGVPGSRLRGMHFYAGPLSDHFGHFMAECTHRLWAFPPNARHVDQILLLPQLRPGGCYPDTYDNLLSFQQQALQFMGIPGSRVTLIKEPVQVDELLVPEPAASLQMPFDLDPDYLDYLSENEARFFQSYRSMRTHYPEKIYVSRAAFLHEGGIAGEQYLQSQLEAEGFFVVRPQQLPLFEQLNHYRHARCCIFSEGSAVHGMQLLGRLSSDATFVVISRRPRNLPEFTQVIAPRNGRTLAFTRTRPLPPLDQDFNAQRMAHARALSLVNSVELVEFLRREGLASLPGFSFDRFEQHETADVARFLVRAPIDHASAETFLNNFRRFQTEMVCARTSAVDPDRSARPAETQAAKGGPGRLVQ